MVPTVLIPSAPKKILARDSREAHLAQLIRESHAHAALNHDWLRRVGACAFGDMRWVMQDYAREYFGYSAAFPQYLETVIGKLENPEHRALLSHNLEEEQGEMGADDREELAKIGIDPETVDGVPHPELFRRFCEAIGVSDAELRVPSYAAMQWRRQFLNFLQNATPAAAVGALGLGTENVVKPIYRNILNGVRSLGLRREDYVFFELHCTVDDQHALDLHNVALDLLQDQKARQEMRLGMREALDLRARFWNHLNRRADSVLRVATA